MNKLPSAVAGIEPSISNCKSISVTTVPPSHTSIVDSTLPLNTWVHFVTNKRL